MRFNSLLILAVFVSGIGSTDLSEEHVLQLELEVAQLRQQLASTLGAHPRSLESAGSSSGGSSGSSGSSGSASADHSGGHQHDALVYMVMMLIVGTAILHMTTLPAFHGLPYTVVLFIVGALISIIMGAMGEGSDSLGVMGRSYWMWMDIDPHTLIFTLLPMLLTGDAMTIDTYVARRVSSQCVWLAGPGVLINSFATAGFLYFYFDWEFLLCATLGAILAATDPVAVVGLLKELGASPTLTVQIQGESLLNDGTAIVMFQAAYRMLSGEVIDVKGIFLLIVYMVGCSWFLGMIIGGAFSSWIRSASNRLEHHSSMIQISLTLCCGYFSFIFSEGIVGISGVLSTVASGLVLADTIWPKIVNPGAMHEVWHTFEYLGNTIIFLLAGALSGEAMGKVDASDYGNLFILYFVCLVIRGAVIFASRPILQRLDADREPVPFGDALVMTWGGLRGAVGLALAIQVAVDKAGGKVSDKNANQVLFYTGGIAMLTLIFNATTCPALVSHLGITATPHAKARVLLHIQRRLAEANENNPKGVQMMLDDLLSHCKVNIWKATTETDDNIDEIDLDQRTGDSLLQTYYAAKYKFDSVGEKHQILMGWDPENPILCQEKTLLRLLDEQAEISMVRTLNEAFIGLVRQQYWSKIERNEFATGTSTADKLLVSNTHAYQLAGHGLKDYEMLCQKMEISPSEADEDVSALPVRVKSSGSLAAKPEQDDSGRSILVEKCELIISSVKFNGCIVSLILINAITIFTDPGPNQPNSLLYLTLECIFMVFYTIEMVMKMIVLRFKYFTDGWNALDFMCVILGAVGITTGILLESGIVKSNALSGELMLIRLGRVFKLARVMRVVLLVKFVRLLHAKHISKKVITGELAERLDAIQTLRAFVQSHVAGQTTFLKYFGIEQAALKAKMSQKTEWERTVSFTRQDSWERQFSGANACLSEAEEARCIVQSMTSVYTAISMGARRIKSLDLSVPWMIDSMCAVRDSCVAVEHLSDFVCSAVKDGIIQEKDADILTSPLHQHLGKSSGLLADVHAGIHQTKMKRFVDEDVMRKLEVQKKRPRGGAEETNDFPSESNRATSALEIKKAAELSQDIGQLNGTFDDNKSTKSTESWTI